MKAVDNLFKKHGENTFIENKYVVGTHWNWFYGDIPSIPTTYITENKENFFENYMYMYLVSCLLSLFFLNISNCQSVLKQIVYICTFAW